MTKKHKIIQVQSNFMPNKKLLIKMLGALLLLSFYSKQGYCQKGYVTGYIVTPSNDTIQTPIKQNDLGKNLCIYIDSLGKSCLGTRETVKSFATSDKRMFRQIRFDDKKKPVEAYFEVLADGKINLYSYRGRFFVQKDNGEVKELLNTVVDGINDKGANYIRNKKEYVGLLKFLLADSTTPLPEVATIDLIKKDLVKLIRIYNEGESYIQELNKQKYRPTVKFGIEALFATDIYRFYFPSTWYIDEYRGQFLLPGIGGSIKYQFTAHLSLNSAVRLKYLNYSIYKSYGAESSQRYYTLKNNFFTLAVPLIINYQLTNLPFHPYAGFGIQIEKSFLKNSVCIEEANSYSASDFYTHERQTNFANPINTYLAFELGADKPVGKCSLILKAQYLIDNSFLNSKIASQFYHQSGLQLVFGVQF
jgi:hypothetical protein